MGVWQRGGREGKKEREEEGGVEQSKVFPSLCPSSICMPNEAEQELIAGVMTSDWLGCGLLVQERAPNG